MIHLGLNELLSPNTHHPKILFMIFPYQEFRCKFSFYLLLKQNEQNKIVKKESSLLPRDLTLLVMSNGNSLSVWKDNL